MARIRIGPAASPILGNQQTGKGPSPQITDPSNVPNVGPTIRLEFERALRTQRDRAAIIGATETPSGAPVDITGTSDVTFGFSTAAQGVEIFTGTAASSFSWSTASSGKLTFTGSAASTFTFSSSSSGKEVFSGAGGSAWVMADSSAGLEIFSGAAASTFTWSDASSGVEIFSAIAASTFTFSSAAAGTVEILDVTGGSASTFGFSSSSSGTIDNPVIPDVEASGDRTFRVRADPTLPRLKIWIHGASSFGWGSAARAIVIPPIYGLSASSFGAGISAEGDVDVADLLIHLEDERLLMGIGELELV